jgi:hypothetical protein
MSLINAVGFFCDDIREEVGPKDSVMGIYPDNITVPVIPWAFARLCVYVRLNIGTEWDQKNITIHLRFEDGKQIEIARFKPELIESEFKGAKERGAPLVGLVAKVVASPLHISVVGRIRVVAIAGDAEILCATLHVILEPSPAST